jgi:hypothetical protein
MCANVKHFAHNEINEVYSPIGIDTNEKSFQYESDIINARTPNCTI